MLFKSLALLSAVGGASAFVSRSGHKAATSQLSESKADLEKLAKDLNPVVGYFDPLMLAETSFWGQSNEATIGFLRQAEIKHGRVAMAAFVGYVVQSNFVAPYPQSLSGAMAPGTDLTPEAQWDESDVNARLQILFVIGLLEIWDEMGGGIKPHYMRGGQPGKYPSFEKFRDTIHPVLDLYDPAGFSKNMSEEKRQKRLLAEINNGRLAMIGIMGFLAADKVPGSVPAIEGISRGYSGSTMNPFELEIGGNPWSMAEFAGAAAQ